MAVFRPGRSSTQAAALRQKYNPSENWAKQEDDLLFQHGFNGGGAWSDVDLIRDNHIPLVYTVIANPMGSYKHSHLEARGGKYEMAGRQGYRYDLVMAFDPEFDAHVDKSIAPIAQYANDRFLLGYYTDNELPSKNDALGCHLEYLAEEEGGYQAPERWLDERKGKGASLADATDQDRLEFCGCYLETYVRKVTRAIRKYDPTHL